MIARGDSEFSARNLVRVARCEAELGVRYFVVHSTLLNAITVRTPSDIPSTLRLGRIREAEPR